MLLNAFEIIFQIILMLNQSSLRQYQALFQSSAPTELILERFRYDVRTAFAAYRRLPLQEMDRMIMKLKTYRYSLGFFSFSEKGWIQGIIDVLQNTRKRKGNGEITGFENDGFGKFMMILREAQKSKFEDLHKINQKVVKSNVGALSSQEENQLLIAEVIEIDKDRKAMWIDGMWRVYKNGQEIIKGPGAVQFVKRFTKKTI